VHERDPLAAHRRDRVHRQGAEARAQFGKAAGGRAQRREDRIRPCHLGIADPVRVRAAAARRRVVARELGLDIAAQRDVREDPRVERREVVGRSIEPVEVAVEDQRRRDRLRGGEREDRVERERVAVEPADRIDRLGVDFRRAAEDGRRVAVRERTVAAGR